MQLNGTTANAYHDELPAKNCIGHQDEQATGIVASVTHILYIHILPLLLIYV